MIRDKIYNDIANILDSHERFEVIDFKIESRKNGISSTSLVITYKFKPEYKIAFQIPSQETHKEGKDPYYSFSGSVIPGPLSYTEQFSFQGQDGVFSKISKWLDSVWEELSIDPRIRTIEEQQEQIDEIFEKFDSLNDDFFTKDEALEIKKKLDELEEILKSQLTQNSEDKKKLEEEITKLHTDIDTLKQTIGSFNKKGWLKNFTGKVFKWTSDSENRKLLKDGYSFVKEYLPEHIKNALPE